MRTIFWKFAYDESLLKEILSSEELPFPDLKYWPKAKNNSQEKVISDLRAGNYVLLANFNSDTEVGIVKGVGRIETAGKEGVVMRWKKPIPSWSLTPDIPGGVLVWRDEGVFCFDAQPAKRYKLESLTKKLFDIA